MIPTDCFALRAPAILQNIRNRSFFCEKRLLSHVLAGPNVIQFHVNMKCMILGPWYLNIKG